VGHRPLTTHTTENGELLLIDEAVLASDGLPYTQVFELNDGNAREVHTPLHFDLDINSLRPDFNYEFDRSQLPGKIELDNWLAPVEPFSPAVFPWLQSPKKYEGKIRRLKDFWTNNAS
jgi:hypothetical protein